MQLSPSTLFSTFVIFASSNPKSARSGLLAHFRHVFRFAVFHFGVARDRERGREGREREETGRDREREERGRESFRCSPFQSGQREGERERVRERGGERGAREGRKRGERGAKEGREREFIELN